MFSPTCAPCIRLFESAVHICQQLLSFPWYEKRQLKANWCCATKIMAGLDPSLDQEHHRKLHSCLIAEFEAAKLLDIDSLQGLVQVIEAASPDYLQPDELVRILSVLCARLQDALEQMSKHLCYLVRALSRVLDVMVEGKVKDLRRFVDHEPLSALLD